jgi:hypothetical protein
MSSLVLGAILANGLPASATFLSGNDLVKAMRQFEKAERKDKQTRDDFYVDAERYRSFVVGVSDALDETSFCLPEGSTVSQICAVVAKYLKAIPEEWNQPAVILVTRALKKAFPCKK